MTNQNWTTGQTVRVGFLILMITEVRNLADRTEYTLVSSKGIEYTFSPYQGLKRKPDTNTLLVNRGD